MTFSAFQIALALYFALGLRIGWTGQLLVLLIASVIACLAAFLFVSPGTDEYILSYLVAAIASDATIQVGFVVGLLTAARPDSRGTSTKTWLQAAINRIDDRGMPNDIFSRLTALAARATGKDD